jgi:ABC-type bacteriocin/lantibiotic exporter with double-glycine peptidase domain
MYQLGELLAVIAPLLWWLLVDRLAPRRRRAPLWLLGLVVTAPWPLVAGVVA